MQLILVQMKSGILFSMLPSSKTDEEMLKLIND